MPSSGVNSCARLRLPGAEERAGRQDVGLLVTCQVRTRAPASAREETQSGKNCSKPTSFQTNRATSPHSWRDSIHRLRQGNSHENLLHSSFINSHLHVSFSLVKLPQSYHSFHSKLAGHLLGPNGNWLSCCTIWRVAAHDKTSSRILSLVL